MPSNANMTIKRKSSNSREAIDCIEFKRDATRLDRERQYLKNKWLVENRQYCQLNACLVNPDCSQNILQYFALVTFTWSL